MGKVKCKRVKTDLDGNYEMGVVLKHIFAPLIDIVGVLSDLVKPSSLEEAWWSNRADIVAFFLNWAALNAPELDFKEFPLLHWIYKLL